MYPFPTGDKWPILEADVKTLVIRRGGWNGTQNSLTPWDPEAKTEGNCEQWNQLTDHIYIYIFSIYIYT